MPVKKWNHFLNFSLIKGGNLDFTSRVICACFNQIMNLESWKWPPLATFKSWTNKSALSFLDFALLHGQKQVLSQIVTFLKVMKIRENWSVWFVQIFMYPGLWKFEKIEASVFVKFHVPGHQNSKKLKLLIFARFHVPGVMKIRKDRSFRFLQGFMYPKSWKFKKASDFCEFSWKKRRLLFQLLKVATGGHFQDSKFMIWLKHAQITLLVKSRLPPFWIYFCDFWIWTDYKEYFPNLLETAFLHQIFVFWVGGFKF